MTTIELVFDDLGLNPRLQKHSLSTADVVLAVLDKAVASLPVDSLHDIDQILGTTIPDCEEDLQRALIAAAGRRVANWEVSVRREQFDTPSIDSHRIARYNPSTAATPDALVVAQADTTVDSGLPLTSIEDLATSAGVPVIRVGTTDLLNWDAVAPPERQVAGPA